MQVYSASKWIFLYKVLKAHVIKQYKSGVVISRLCKRRKGYRKPLCIISYEKTRHREREKGE